MLRLCHRIDIKGSQLRSDGARAFGADDVVASGLKFRKLRFQMITDIQYGGADGSRLPAARGAVEVLGDGEGDATWGWLWSYPVDVYLYSVHAAGDAADVGYIKAEFRDENSGEVKASGCGSAWRMRTKDEAARIVFVGVLDNEPLVSTRLHLEI
ncbi:MAG: hypothetical protein R2729_29350 [Bryobacteraceae bacterium]